MTAVDTSLVVALFASWHEAHDIAREAVADRGITGGAVYDALVAATAMNAKATLLTRDHRAARTYEAVGVRYRLIG